MPSTEFDRDSKALWYGRQHLETDQGIAFVFHLPKNAEPTEIRLLEVNDSIGDRNDDALEPIDFGVDMETPLAHKLFILDVTPDQWERIQTGKLALPNSWSIDELVVCTR